jgi:hypothetical protein
VKLVWLLSVPVIALVALFAVRSSPTFAGPACADSCGGVVADQGMLSSYGGNYIYQQVPGQYCTDKTGGMIYVAVGAPTPSGVNCGGSAAASPAASATAAASGTSAPAATGTAAAASATAKPSATAAAASATATGTPSH